MRLLRQTVLILALATLFGAAEAQAADPARGKLVYGQCFGCHAIGPHPHVKVGPPLDGVIGRHWAFYPGYDYSAALKAGGREGKTWTPATLSDWLKDPSAMVPGTKMHFMGLDNPRDRADVLAYLAQFNSAGQKR